MIASLGVNRTLFAGCEISLADLIGGMAVADFDRQRLGDALLSILEILAAMRAARIEITITLPGLRLTVTADCDTVWRAFDSDKATFFRLTLMLKGLTLMLTDAQEKIELFLLVFRGRGKLSLLSMRLVGANFLRCPTAAGG